MFGSRDALVQTIRISLLDSKSKYQLLLSKVVYVVPLGGPFVRWAVIRPWLPQIRSGRTPRHLILILIPARSVVKTRSRRYATLCNLSKLRPRHSLVPVLGLANQRIVPFVRKSTRSGTSGWCVRIRVVEKLVPRVTRVICNRPLRIFIA